MAITTKWTFLWRSCNVAFACPYLHKAFAPEYLSSWALVAVGIAAGLIAWKTLGRIEDQVASGNVAANAAAESTNAMVQGERALLIARPEFPGPYPAWYKGKQFSWSVTNVGETPAVVLHTQAVFELVDDGSLAELPEQPNLPAPIDAKGLQLVKGDSYSFETYLGAQSQEISPGFAESLRSERIYLRCYGHVRYIDIFKKEHYARFCHYFKLGPNPTESNFKWLLGAPAAYFEQT